MLYVAWYGLGRFFIEGLRTDSLMAGKFRVSQLVAAASFAAAVVLYVVFKIVSKKKSLVLYVNSEASQQLMENDRLAEAERIAKKKAKKNQKSPAADETLISADSKPDLSNQAEEAADTDDASSETEKNDKQKNDDIVENTNEEKENENGTDN